MARSLGISLFMALAGAPAIHTAAQQLVSPANVFGYMSWCESKEDFGWYKFDQKLAPHLVWLDNTDVNPAYFITGWVRDGKLCGIYGNHSDEHYIEYNEATGEFIGITQVDIEGENHYRYIATGAYNPNDDYVYGFSFSKDFSKDYFVKAPASDVSQVEIIREMPRYFMLCFSCCFNTKDNHMYGVDGYGDLIRVDVNGNFEFLASYNLNDSRKLADYATGMCYSPREDCFYWNTQFSTYESQMTRIDAKTYKYEKVREYPIFDHYTVLSCIDSDGHDQGPKAPEFISTSISGAAQSGEFKYKMPTEMADGSEMPTSLSWTARVENTDQVFTGTAAPGEEVSVNYQDLPVGKNSIEFFASAGELKGVSHHYNAWIGSDVPDFPRNLKVANAGWGDFDLSWSPVSRGAHGADFDAESLVYAVFANNQQILTTKETHARVNLPAAPGKGKLYQIVVYAANNAGVSEDAAWANVTSMEGAGTFFSLNPYDEHSDEVVILNPDNDDSSWKIAKDFYNDNCFYSSSDKTNRSDDWLITPAMNVTKVENMYELSFNACANSNTKKEEYLEVYLGTEPNPESMKLRCIMPKTQILGVKHKEYTAKFDFPEAGTYYIGFRCVSEPGMAGIYVKNINVNFTDVPASVAAITSDNMNVRAVAGGLQLDGCKGAVVDIYTVSGSLQASMKPSSESEFVELPTGTYVVKAASKAFKVIVK